MVPLKIDLCGPLAVRSDGLAVAGLTSPKMQALLAYLVVEDDRPHARTVLASLLWPERPEQAARQNLRQTLSRLRRALGPHGADLLRVSRSDVAWQRRAGVAVDYWTVRETVRTVARHDHASPAACDSCCAAMTAAAALYRGEFLAGLEPDSVPLEEWLLLQREWLRREVLAFRHHLVEHHERRGRLEEAQAHAWAQIELDPLRETAHQQLMRLLARTGRFSDALAHYDTLVDRLADELGVAPAAETADLVARIRRGEVSVAPSAPALHLPAPFSALVGREAELAEIAAVFDRAGRPLLTIAGPGGVGKTRLSIAAAEALAPAFPDGVYFVDLTEVAAADDAVDAVAEALAVAFDRDADAGARQGVLLASLAPRRSLLVIDNYEQLLPDVSLPLAILGAAPQVALLITSRAPLGLRAESVLSLTGLPLSAETDRDAPAVRLFAAAAGRARAGFRPTADDRRSIAAIARSVAGLPLGLELAAALVRHYPLQTIARELDKSLDFAATNMPDLPERHRSLRAVFDHSVSLLSGDARRALRHLAVFAGPFSYEAAEVLLSGDLASLRRLQEFGLVGNTEQGLLRLHPLLQQYAREALARAGEMEQAAEAHAVQVVDWLVALHEDPSAAALARFRRAVADVNAAWHWAANAGRGDLLRRMTAPLLRFNVLTGHADVGLALMETALAHWKGDAAVRRALLLAEGRFAFRLGLYPRATKALRAGLALASKEAPAETVRGHLMLAHVLTNQGDYDPALATLDSALRQAQAANLASLEGDVWRSIGNVYSNRGDLPAARTAYERALPLSDESHPRGRAATLSNLGSVCTRSGDFTGARRYDLQALAIHQQLGDAFSEAVTRCDLAFLELETGDFDAANAQLATGRALLPPTGAAHVLADLELIQADLALARAAYASTAAILPGAATVYSDLGEEMGRTAARLLEARLLLSLGMYEHAERELADVLAEMAALGDISGEEEARIWLSRLLSETGRGPAAAAMAAQALTAATEGERVPQAAAAQLALALALAAQGKIAPAREAARAALARRRLLGQLHLAAAPLALLIRLALEEEAAADLADPLAELDGLLAQWHGGGLLRFAAAYLAGNDGYLALGDTGAARRLLEAGQTRLALAAESLDRPAWRHALTTRVPANRALLAR